MTRVTVKFLLNKLPKEKLIETIINSYEILFKNDPKGLEEAYKQLALTIQGFRVVSEETNIENFQEPFRTELSEYIESTLKHSSRKRS